MKAVILAGGLGTRLSEETVLRPKPMVEIGGMPLLWHVMSIYAAHGIKEFIIALGYKSEVIKDFFVNFYTLSNDITVDLRSGSVSVHDGDRLDWRVHLVDTGLETQTGGRLLRLRSWLPRDESFMLTYGDGVADIDIGALAEFHRAHGRLATVTAVRPPARFGHLNLDDGRVLEFAEKRQSAEGWINGGFFVLEPSVLEYIRNDATIWEREPLEAIARDGQLRAYRHEGFWQAMDTLRDRNYLEELWRAGRAPWRVWL